MLQVDRIQDAATLRQIAGLLERENDRLHGQVRKLVEEITRLRGDDPARLQRELALLEELLEKREEAPQVASPASAPKERRPSNGHGPRCQPELPLVEEVYELPQTERDCPVCGLELSEMTNQFEDSEEITVVQRKFVLTKCRRRKYRCRCNASVVTAKGPLKLKAGSRYSVDFAIEVAISKYLDHLPLERQVRTMRRESLVVDSQTLYDQLETLARHLTPTYKAIRDRVLKSPLVHADETSWRLLQKGSKLWWAWAVSNHDAVHYQIRDSRATESAADLLDGYEGTVMADGYGVYESLSRASPKIRLVNCWAHARRKFEETSENWPTESAEMLSLIGEIYAIEREIPAWDPSAPKEDQHAALEERRRVRMDRSRAVLARIRDWIYAQRCLPQSELGKAIAYVGGRWAGLTAFVEDPRVPLDNNHAERTMRGPVLGRKNHYGSKSKRGTEVAAILYTLLETAKLAGVEPKAYLKVATRNAIQNPGAVTLAHDFVNATA
jgi:transposase